MAITVMLADVPVGASFALGARLTANDAAGLHLALLTRDRQVIGQQLIATDLVISGLLTENPAAIPVSLAGRPFSAGDVVVSDTTRETMVVRDAWLDTASGEFHWSNSPTRRPAYTTQGWNRVGTATIT